MQKLSAWEWYQRTFCGLKSVRFTRGEGPATIEQLAKSAYLIVTGDSEDITSRLDVGDYS